MPSKSLLRASVFVALSAFAASAFAGEVTPEAQEAARKTYQAGAQAYSDGHYKDAIDLFLEAARVAPNPAFSYNIGLAYEQLGDHDNALRWYRDYLRELPEAPDRGDIEPRVREAEQRLRERGVQQVTVMSSPDGATVTIDGKPLGVTPWTGELAPGRHKLSLMLRSYADDDQVFELPSDHAIDVRVSLSEAPSHEATAAPVTTEPSKPDSAPHRSGGIGPLTWAAFGVGAVGLGSALGFELARSGAADSARQAPTQVEGKDDRDRAVSFETLGRVALGVGAAFTVAGGVLLYLDLSSSKSERSPSASAAFGCGAASCGVRVNGRF
jgi:tetratricopeptide (TPR) repeat protein